MEIAGINEVYARMATFLCRFMYVVQNTYEEVDPMGIYIRYLSEIPKEYKIYGVFIANPFGTVAERVVAENFERIAFEIGSENIVARLLTWEGRDQAEEKFGIKVTDLRPILVITEVHPAEWTPKLPMIKIQLGKVETEDAVKNFLLQLTRWLTAEDLGRIQWELRLQRLKELARPLPAIIELLSISILAVFANPRGSDPLRLGAEDRVIHECLKLSKYRDNISFDVLHAATIHDVRRALLSKEYHIVHFSGHGTGNGLAFENELGQTRLIPQDALAEFLSAYSPPIECVILNACYSATQGRLISLGVPFTISMDGAISDEGATEFTRGFYDAIGAGKDIEFAYQEGCRTIKLMGLPDGLTPVLFK